jgi:polygalacturonase
MRSLPLTYFLLALCYCSWSVANTPLSRTGADAVIEAIEPPVNPDRTINVLEAGVPGDGTTDARPALQRVIDQAAEEGGAKLVFAPGTYVLNGPLLLRSGIHLHLMQGSRLQFSGVPDHFLTDPLVKTRWEGTLLYSYSPFIYANKASDLAITGPGSINGNGGEHFAAWRESQKESQLRLREMGDALTPLNERQFGKGSYLRPSFIQFYECERILIDGPTLNDSPFWMLHFVFSNRITVRNTTFDSHRINNDGIDIDSSSQVLIEHNTFDTGDDAIVLKSGRDREGRDLGKSAHHVVARFNHIKNAANGLAIGSEMSGGVHDVYFLDSIIGTCGNGVYFKSNLDRGGIVENVLVDNISLEKSSYAALRFQTNYGGLREGGHPPVFRNFHIRNMTVLESQKYGIVVQGHASAPVTNVEIENVHIGKARHPAHVEPHDKVTLNSVSINGEQVIPSALSEEDRPRRRW